MRRRVTSRGVSGYGSSHSTQRWVSGRSCSGWQRDSKKPQRADTGACIERGLKVWDLLDVILIG